MKGPSEKGGPICGVEYMKGGQMVTPPCAPLPTIEFKYLQLVSTCNCFAWCMIARRVSKPNICTPPPCPRTTKVCYYGSPHQGGPYQSLTGTHTP